MTRVSPTPLVGISAIFDGRITPHARTFLRAVAVARNLDPQIAALRFGFADDGAEPEAAARVADELCRQGAEIVVGHFSSDAAITAAKVYEAEDIPLILPAATLPELTRSQGNVFRLCPHDLLLAQNLAGHLAGQGVAFAGISADETRHGAGLRLAIAGALQAAGIAAVKDRRLAQRWVFCGRLGNAMAFLESLPPEHSLPVVLTDDAVSDAWLDHPRAGQIEIIGFPPASSYTQAQVHVADHRARFGVEPGVYFLESIAALQIVAQLAGIPRAGRMAALKGGEFATVLGTLRFCAGEAAGATHAIWKIRHGRWVTERPRQNMAAERVRAEVAGLKAHLKGVRH